MKLVSDLTEDPANVREHDEKNLAVIRASLLEHGQVEPLVVQQSTGRVIGGNGRLTVMRELGWTEAWVNLLDITNTQATRLSLVLNRSAELASWREKPLLDILGSLEEDGEDITGLGWEEEDVARLADKLSDVDVPTGDTDEDPFAGAGGASDDVSFKFGDYAGHVSRVVYDSFVATYRERQRNDGGVLLDDIMRGWLGV